MTQPGHIIEFRQLVKLQCFIVPVLPRSVGFIEDTSHNIHFSILSEAHGRHRLLRLQPLSEMLATFTVQVCRMSASFYSQLSKPWHVMESSSFAHLFDRLLNFRDVGVAINTSTKTQTLRPRIFYRSALPDGASEADRAHLTQNLGIKTIIDLRSKTEHIKATKKHASDASAAVFDSALVPQANGYVSTPLQIPGIRYVEINLNGGAFERALLWQLNYASLARLVCLITLGYREDAISILGREVMRKRGLIGLGVDTLDYSITEIRAVFDVLADEDNYPVLVHCTQGKDRTGLIVLLVLMLCGVDKNAIADDYMRSERELEVGKEERLDLSEDFAVCPEGFVHEMTKHINERYDGIGKYLCSIDVDVDVQQSVQNIMTYQAA